MAGYRNFLKKYFRSDSQYEIDYLNKQLGDHAPLSVINKLVDIYVTRGCAYPEILPALVQHLNEVNYQEADSQIINPGICQDGSDIKRSKISTRFTMQYSDRGNEIAQVDRNIARITKQNRVSAAIRRISEIQDIINIHEEELKKTMQQIKINRTKYNELHSAYHSYKRQAIDCKELLAEFVSDKRKVADMIKELKKSISQIKKLEGIRARKKGN